MLVTGPLMVLAVLAVLWLAQRPPRKRILMRRMRNTLT